MSGSGISGKRLSGHRPIPVARFLRLRKGDNHTAKKFVVTTDSKHNEPVAPNLLERRFNTSSQNQVLVSDIRWLKVGSKWCYLTVFLDLFSQIVVGSGSERFS